MYIVERFCTVVQGMMDYDKRRLVDSKDEE